MRVEEECQHMAHNSPCFQHTPWSSVLISFQSSHPDTDLSRILDHPSNALALAQVRGMENYAQTIPHFHLVLVRILLELDVRPSAKGSNCWERLMTMRYANCTIKSCKLVKSRWRLLFVSFNRSTNCSSNQTWTSWCRRHALMYVLWTVYEMANIRGLGVVFKCLTHCQDVVSRCHSGTSDEHRPSSHFATVLLDHPASWRVTHFVDFFWWQLVVKSCHFCGRITVVIPQRPTSLPSLTCSHSRMWQASPTSPNSRISWLSLYVRWWLRASCFKKYFCTFAVLFQMILVSSCALRAISVSTVDTCTGWWFMKGGFPFFSAWRWPRTLRSMSSLRNRAFLMSYERRSLCFRGCFPCQSRQHHHQSNTIFRTIVSPVRSKLTTRSCRSEVQLCRLRDVLHFLLLFSFFWCWWALIYPVDFDTV